MAITTLLDSSGNSVHGTYDGDKEQAVAAKVLNAASFPGIKRGQIAAASVPTITTPFTWECWARVNAQAPGEYGIPMVCRSDAAAGGNQGGPNFYSNDPLWAEGQKWSGWWGFGTGMGLTWAKIQGEPWVLGAWKHLALTHDGVTGRFYNDAVLQGSLVRNFTTPIPQADSLYFGSKVPGSGANLSVDEAVWTPSVLSAGQLAARIALVGNPNAYAADVLADDPVAYWKFDESVGSGANVPLRQRQKLRNPERMRQQVR